MTVYFQDTFSGSGSLIGHLPDVNFHPSNGNGWQTPDGNYLRMDGGWVTIQGATITSAAVIMSNGNNNTDWGQAVPPAPMYGPVAASFTVRTPTDLTASGTGVLGIKLHLNGVLMLCGLNRVSNQWWLSMTGAPGQVVGGSLAPNTVYHLEAVFQNGASSVTITELGVTQNSTTAFTSSVGLSAVYACATQNGALGPVTLSSVAGAVVSGLGAAPAVFGAVAAKANFLTAAQASALGRAPALLGACAGAAQNDFTRLLGDVISVYVMDLLTPTGTVRVPISSWQATLRAGSSSYVQCVVPACGQWMAAIRAATEFVISRRAVLPSGQALEVEMARTPAEQPRTDQGPQRYTCTLSGYAAGLAAVTDPSAAYDRTLTDVRSVSSDSGLRVRCAVDWLLRPGQRAWVNGSAFVVSYINYYCPADYDRYMDVGQQDG